MDKQELRAWLRLTLSGGVGNEAARKLLIAFGSAQAIFDQSASALAQIDAGKLAKAIQTEPEGLAALLKSTLEWLQAGDDRLVAALGEAAYPAALLNIEDPPLMLYMLGSHAKQLLAGTPHTAPNIAIVGSRNPTPQGETNARQFARAFGSAGLCVVSGLALGIDGRSWECWWFLLSGLRTCG